MVDQKRGLSSIPKHIKNELSATTLAMLKKDGYGISFPHPSFVQVRYFFHSFDLGGVYTPRKFQSIELMFQRIIADVIHLRKQYPNSAYGPDPTKGVRFAERFRPDRNMTEYMWAIAYYRDGKLKIKNLYCGNENTMSTERKKHAEMTAWHFRRLYCETLDPDVFLAENMVNWQGKKYY